MLVTFERYRDITGDRASDQAEVTARIEEATTMIEEEIRRPLVSAERTEAYPLGRDYRIYPRAIPITAIPAGASYAIEDEVTLRNVTADDISGWAYSYEPFDVQATVVYTGGYTSATVPMLLARDIAALAESIGLMHPSSGSSNVPLGATSISLGDASVTFARATEGLDMLVPGLTARLKRRRWRGRLSTPGVGVIYG